MSSSVGAKESQPNVWERGDAPRAPSPHLEAHHRGTEDLAVTGDEGCRPPFHPKVKAQH